MFLVLYLQGVYFFDEEEMVNSLVIGYFLNSSLIRILCYNSTVQEEYFNYYLKNSYITLKSYDG